MAQLGPGPGRSPPLIPLFAVANSLEMPTGRCSAPETGEAEVALGVLLCRPSVGHIYQRLSLAFLLARFSLCPGPYIHHTVRARSTPHAVGLLLLLRVPACLPAFPSPLAARSTCSSRSSSKQEKPCLGWLLLRASIYRLSNQEQRQIRGFLESGRSIKSQVSHSPARQLASHQITLIKSKGTKRISLAPAPPLLVV